MSEQQAPYTVGGTGLSISAPAADPNSAINANAGESQTEEKDSSTSRPPPRRPRSTKSGSAKGQPSETPNDGTTGEIVKLPPELNHFLSFLIPDVVQILIAPDTQADFITQEVHVCLDEGCYILIQLPPILGESKGQVLRVK